MDWFLYDTDLCHERVKFNPYTFSKPRFLTFIIDGYDRKSKRLQSLDFLLPNSCISMTFIVRTPLGLGGDGGGVGIWKFRISGGGQKIFIFRGGGGGRWGIGLLGGVIFLRGRLSHLASMGSLKSMI